MPPLSKKLLNYKHKGKSKSGYIKKKENPSTIVESTNDDIWSFHCICEWPGCCSSDPVETHPVGDTFECTRCLVWSHSDCTREGGSIKSRNVLLESGDDVYCRPCMMVTTVFDAAANKAEPIKCQLTINLDDIGSEHYRQYLNDFRESNSNYDFSERPFGAVRQKEGSKVSAILVNAESPLSGTLIQVTIQALGCTGPSNNSSSGKKRRACDTCMKIKLTMQQCMSKWRKQFVAKKEKEVALQMVEKLRNDDELEANILAQIRKEKCDEYNVENQLQSTGRPQSSSCNNCDLLQGVNVENRKKISNLKQTIRRKDVIIADLKLAAKEYLNSKFLINIVGDSEITKWHGFLQLATDLISKECAKDDNDIRQKTLLAVFKETYQSFGKFNKNGEKNGIRNTKIPPRIMHLAVSLIKKLGRTTYDRMKQSMPFLPGFTVIQNYLRNIKTDTGFHEEYLEAAKMQTEIEGFPVHAKEVMAFMVDEMIIIRGIAYSINNYRVLGFTDSISLSELSEVVIREMVLLTPDANETAASDAAARANLPPPPPPLHPPNVWVHVKVGKSLPDMDFTYELVADETLPLPEQHLLVTYVNPRGFAYIELGIRNADKIFGFGITSSTKDRRVTPEGIVNFINTQAERFAHDMQLRKDDRAERKRLGLKARKKGDKLIFETNFQFKKYTLCRQHGAFGPNDNILGADLGQHQLNEDVILRSVVQHYSAKGYTQVRLITLAAPNFDYLVYDCISFPLNSNEMKELMEKCLHLCLCYGFFVAAIICDGASANRKYYKEFFVHGGNAVEGLMPTFMNHPTTNQPVYFIPDPDHVVKKLASSIGNENHKILKTDTTDGANNRPCIISMEVFHKLWMSFSNTDSPRTFRLTRNVFLKTSFEKMRVPLAMKLFSQDMIDMLEYSISLSTQYHQAVLDKNETIQNEYYPWRDCRDMFRPMLDIVHRVKSIWDILNRSTMPGLSVNPNCVRELDKFDEVREWFCLWREECFARASAQKYRENEAALGLGELHKSFFTIEASNDFILMLTAIPQLVKAYTFQRDDLSWVYLIAGRICNGPLENRWATYKCAGGGGNMSANTIQQISRMVETGSTQGNMNRYHKRKMNTAGIVAERNNNGQNNEEVNFNDPVAYDEYNTALNMRIEYVPYEVVQARKLIKRNARTTSSRLLFDGMLAAVAFK